MTGCVKMQLGNQTCVELSAEKKGKIMVEGYHPLYDRLLRLKGGQIADFKPNQPFHILFSIFGGTKAIYLQIKWWNIR